MFKHTVLFAFLLSGIVPDAAVSQSLCWEVSGNGLEQPSYLYGTIHSQDKRVFHFSDSTLECFDKSTAVALELNMDSIDRSAVLPLLVMDSNITLHNLLDTETYVRLEQYFKDSLHQPLFLFDKMQPMFTASLISQQKLGKEEAEAMDMYFYKTAKEKGKVIYGLEKMEEQVGAFKNIPYKQQAGMLKQSLDEADQLDSTMQRLLNAYINKDLNRLLQLTVEEDSSELFIKVFLTDRNRRMVSRAIPIIKRQSTFIAVGAAHLSGKNGIINLLRKKGYSVQPM